MQSWPSKAQALAPSPSAATSIVVDQSADGIGVDLCSEPSLHEIEGEVLEKSEID